MSSAIIAAESALAQATRAIGAAALREGGRLAARRIQKRFRGNKGRRKARVRKNYKKFRAKIKKGKFNKQQLRNLTHGGIQKAYHYNNLQYCVTEENRLYNVGRYQVVNDSHFEDSYLYHDTMTISNNGYNTVTGNPASTDFLRNDVTLYSELDYTHGLGKWVNTLNPVLAPESALLSNQIYNLRKNFKMWKKDMITFTIQFRKSIDNTHMLSPPVGYYRLIEPITVKDNLNSIGEIDNNDNLADRSIWRTDVRQLSAYQTLQRLYGINQDKASYPAAAGLFPNAIAGASLTPPPLETFTFENISRNPKGWTKIPSKNFRISHVYKTPYSLTTKNNIFQDPIIFFVYKEVPPSWTRQTLQTTGQVLGVDTTINLADHLYTQPEHGNDIVPAIVATMKVAHCYSFKDRAEDIVKIPTTYPDQGELAPN